MKNVSTYVNWWRQVFKPWQRHHTMKTTCDCINSALGSRGLWHRETDRRSKPLLWEEPWFCCSAHVGTTWDATSIHWSVKVWVSRVWLFVTPWTVAHQAPLSVGFSRQEYWSGQPFPSLGHLPNPGIKPGSPTLQVDSFPSGPTGKPIKNTLILPVRLCSSSQNSENINHQEETWLTERKLRHSSCRAVRQRCRGRTRGKAASLQAGRAAWMSPAAPLPTPSASVSLRCLPLKWKCIGERFWGRWFSQTKLTHYKATTGEGKGYPLQCPGLENSRDDAWVTESTRLSDFHCQYH